MIECRWAKDPEPQRYCYILGKAFDLLGLNDPPPQSGTVTNTTTSTPALTPQQQAASDLLLAQTQAATSALTPGPEFLPNPAFNPPGGVNQGRVDYLSNLGLGPGAIVNSTTGADVSLGYELARFGSTDIRIQELSGYAPGTLVNSVWGGDAPVEQEIARLQALGQASPTIPNPDYNPNAGGLPSPPPVVQAANTALTNRINNPFTPNTSAGATGQVGGGFSPTPTPAFRNNPAIQPALSAAQATPPQVSAATPLLTQLATPGQATADMSFLEPFASGALSTDTSALTPFLNATTDTSALDPILSGAQTIDTSALEDFLSGQGQTDLGLLEPFFFGGEASQNPASDLFLRMFEGELGGNDQTQALNDALMNQASSAAVSRNVLSGGSGANSQELADIIKTGTQYLAPFAFDQHQKDQQLRALGAQLYGSTNAQDLARSLDAAAQGTNVRAQDILNELSARGMLTEARAKDVANYLTAASTDITSQGTDLMRQLLAGQSITSSRQQDMVNRLTAAGEIAGISQADLMRNLQAAGALGDLGLGTQANQINALGVAGSAAASDAAAAASRFSSAQSAAATQAAAAQQANAQRFAASLQAQTQAAAQQLQAILGAPGAAATTQNSAIQLQQLPLQNAVLASQALSPIFGLPVGSSSSSTQPLFGPSNLSILGGLAGGAGALAGDAGITSFF